MGNQWTINSSTKKKIDGKERMEFGIKHAHALV